MLTFEASIHLSNWSGSSILFLESTSKEQCIIFPSATLFPFFIKKLFTWNKCVLILWGAIFTFKKSPIVIGAKKFASQFTMGKIIWLLRIEKSGKISWYGIP